jgi:excisionase family DNA binding protein
MTYLSIREVCEVLSVSRWKVTTLINQGELTAIKQGDSHSSHVKIEEDSLRDYIERHRVEASA